MHAYDAKDLKRLFGLPASAVRSLARAGHVTPVRRSGRLHYSFQDLVVLRTASTLRAAKIPAQRINRTLKSLRTTMPGGATLAKLSLMALGNQIAIREGRLLWESDTGQYMLALDIDQEQTTLRRIARAKGFGPRVRCARCAVWFCGAWLCRIRLDRCFVGFIHLDKFSG